MIFIQLQNDYTVIEQILQALKSSLLLMGERAGVRVLMKIYLAILDDALTTLASLIQFLKPG